ncbi:mitochondrial ribonuclease P protein 1 homolog [Palaemon carinicauda]|uniref:mitochondrial ribonuclease P protein 1 homolog n=1 Tax=Palaemon carinicauda TaxID=392227 RepID=UPI0035B69679
MVPTICHRGIGSAVSLLCRSPYSYFTPSCAVRLHSSISVQHTCVWWSYRFLSFHNHHIHAKKKLPLIHQGVHVQYFCNKAKQIALDERTASADTFTEESIGVPSVTTNNIDESNSELKRSRTSVSKFAYDFEETNEAEDESVDRRALIELEVELLRQDAMQVPDTLSPSQWEELLSKPSRSSRRKYLRFLFLNQKKRENLKQKKELQKLERDRQPIDRSKDRMIAEDGHIQYGLWCNSMFLRIHDTTMTHFHNGRVMSAMMHGQPLVIDLGFDRHMTTKERQNCASQLVDSFAFNRYHPDPFYLHFCNAEKSADTVKRLHRYIPTMYDLDFPLTLNPESYLECFPKEKLVYLTPHCNEELTHFDHDAVYIIGAIVDLADSEPLTMAKARKEGIKMRKFPLERYINWGQGHKSLTINQCVNIILDLKHTGDWKYSLRHIPRRKLKRYEDSQTELENYVRKTLKSKQSSNKTLNTRVKRFYDD